MSEARKLQLFRVAAKIPAWLWVPLGYVASWIVAIVCPKPIQQWQINVKTAVGRRPSFLQRRRMIFNWIVNNVASLQLAALSPRQINDRVVIEAEQLAWLKTTFADTGLAVALAHMGSWDLAGAWASTNQLPVVSVAEKLPAGQFEYFRNLREQINIKVYPYDEPGLISKLAAATASRVVCLLSDRDFSARGVPVTWPSGARSTLPAGPAVLAQRTGATLIVITCFFRRGKMIMDVSSAIPVGAGQEGIDVATQLICDEFFRAIDHDCASWLMVQRYFRQEDT